MPAVSVLAATLDPAAALSGFAQSIDAQTLPAAEFELIVVDASSDGSTDRLQQLAGRRPNVTLLTAAADEPEAHRLGAAVERASGRYVLVVRQEQRLAPRALELLLDRARRTGAGMVVGRAVTDRGSGCSVLPDDADGLDPAAVDLAACVALVERSLLPEGREAGAALLDLASVDLAHGGLAAVGRYACVTLGRDPAPPGEGASIEPPATRWDGATLHLDGTLSLPQPPSPPLAAWLVVTQGTAEVAVPATAEPDAGDRAAIRWSAAIDPQTAEGGHPLGDGLWSLSLRLRGAEDERDLALPPGSTRAAVVAGRPYALLADHQGLRLDAGATRSSVIGPVPASDASVAESVRGALVTFALPRLHVSGDGVLDARLMLGGLGLPARLVCAEGVARLEAYVGSLAGTSAVAVLAGGGKPVRTGLQLRVDGTGRMAFEQVPAKRPPAAPTSSAAGAPLAQRLRRRMPGAVEPVVARLSRVPVLRRVYRRLITR